MAYVLCYELIFGQGVRPHGPAERAILAAADDLVASATAEAKAAGFSDVSAMHQSNISEAHPRTARVNLLRMSVAEALQHCQRCHEPALKVGPFK